MSSLKSLAKILSHLCSLLLKFQVKSLVYSYVVKISFKSLAEILSEILQV